VLGLSGASIDMEVTRETARHCHRGTSDTTKEMVLMMADFNGWTDEREEGARSARPARDDTRYCCREAPAPAGAPQAPRPCRRARDRGALRCLVRNQLAISPRLWRRCARREKGRAVVPFPNRVYPVADAACLTPTSRWRYTTPPPPPAVHTDGREVGSIGKRRIQS
jgi:hypothetical protein